MKKVIVTVFILSLLSSCSRESLTVQSQYVHADSLASVHVHSPDPRKKSPSIGQQLIVKWTLPRQKFNELSDENELFLMLHVRFGNRQEEVRKYLIDRPRGGVVYSLLDDNYFQKDGIVTYKADIVTGDGTFAESWRHQVWTDIIKVDIDE